MPIRNGLRTALRAKGRTVLFGLLIFALTLILSLGAGLWGACAQLLRAMDGTYCSVAVAEYMGEAYPDANAADEAARAAQASLDAGALCAVPGVTLWENTDESAVWLEGYTRAQGEMPAFGSGSFALDTAKAWAAKQLKLIACNDLAAAPAFYHSGRPQIAWLDGWDESFLRSQEYGTFLNGIDLGSAGTPVGGGKMPEYPALAGGAFLRENGLQAGDTLTVSMFFSVSYYYNSRSMVNIFTPVEIPLRIVGEIAGTGRELYVPLSFWCADTWLRGEGELVPDGQRLSGVIRTEEDRSRWLYSQNDFEACRFTLRSARDLEAFRAFLAGGSYSRLGKLGKNRTTVLLWDQAFVETAGGLGRYAGFSRALMPALLATVCALGFLVSWLMIQGRRIEFAVLRGLGAPRLRVFASFFLEQALLCLPGCLAGALALTPFFPAGAVWGAAGSFLACYLAGAALSVAAVGRTKLMALLSERE